MDKSYELGKSGIDQMIKDLDKIIGKLEKMDEECHKLAVAGAEQVNKAYDPRFGISVAVHDIPNGSEIEARGENVAFVEFGTGVTHNRTGAYPDRPPEISGIGEYGKGRGKRRAWGYYADAPLLDDDKFILQGDRSVVITHGIPAAMGFVRAKSKIIQRSKTVLKNIMVK